MPQEAKEKAEKVSVHLRLTSEEFRGWAEQFPEAVDRALNRAMEQVEAIAKGATPRRSGELADSVEVTKEGYGLRVRWNAPYARQMNTGSFEYMIRPRGKRPLTFFWYRMGQWRRMWEVTHPAYPGKHFTPKIRELTMQVIRQFIIQELMFIGVRV